jgi:hypothetical protein
MLLLNVSIPPIILNPLRFTTAVGAELCKLCIRFPDAKELFPVSAADELMSIPLTVTAASER